MSPIHSAAYNADLASLRLLLNDGGDVCAVDEKGFTPLHWSCLRACVGEQLPVINALIEAGANLDAKTSGGDSCLAWAVRSGSLDVVRALLAAGADVNLTSDAVTPLMEAAREGNEQLVDCLLEYGADPSPCAGSYSAAHYATAGGHDDLARRLASLVSLPSGPH